MVTLRRPVRSDTQCVGSLAARTYLGLGAAAIALHLAVGGSVRIYDSIGLSAVAAVVVGIARYRPANWRGWAAIAVSQALFVAADIDRDVVGSSPFPGVPDVLHLSGYLALFLGVLLLMGRSFIWRDVASNIDALLASFGVGLAGWMLFLGGNFEVSFERAKLVALAYPFADLIVLGLLFRIALAPGRRNPSYWLLFGAVLPLFVGEATYVMPALGNSHHPGSWLDACWLGSYVLIGAAALHPSMVDFAASVGDTGKHPMRRVLVGGLSLLMMPVCVLIASVTGGSINVPLAAGGGTVLFLGMLVRAVLLVRELDRLRQRAEDSERRFRMVFERSPIGISVGRDGMMSETNPALQSMLGYTGEELARKHYTEVTHKDDLSLAVQQELDAGTRDSFVTYKHNVRKDGTVLDTRVHVSLDLEDGLGMSLIEDVTEQRALEEQLREALKMEAVGKLAGGIAHDFNNLMTAVIGYSELLLRGVELGDPNGEKLEAIRTAAKRASDLTRQLLAFSRRQMMQTEEIDLRDVVLSMEVLLQQVIGEDVELEEVLGLEPVIVHADRAQLEQVVLNFAVNAREAMPDGGTLTIAVNNEGDDAVLTVTDDGRGMDAATQARIFDPFFTTKPLAEAAGLGLSTVHGIVGQSGGTVQVESRVGRGTVFTARLPRVVAARLRDVEAPATLVD
jgi:PAS domain S-box-containing protein